MQDLDQLLLGITSLLFFHGEWHARAQGAPVWAQGTTPREAVERVLGLAAAPADNSDLF